MRFCRERNHGLDLFGGTRPLPLISTRGRGAFLGVDLMSPLTLLRVLLELFSSRLVQDMSTWRSSTRIDQYLDVLLLAFLGLHRLSNQLC